MFYMSISWIGGNVHHQGILLNSFQAFSRCYSYFSLLFWAIESVSLSKITSRIVSTNSVILLNITDRFMILGSITASCMIYINCTYHKHLMCGEFVDNMNNTLYISQLGKGRATHCNHHIWIWIKSKMWWNLHPSSYIIQIFIIRVCS